jgi:CelD/BcsL family acetyltransferase involved in cellulose biosynthesis
MQIRISPTDSTNHRFDVRQWPEPGSADYQCWIHLLGVTGANISLHPEWQTAVVSSHALLEQARLLRVYLGDELVGICPVLLRNYSMHGLPLRSLDLVSNVVSYHAELLSQSDPGIVVGALLEFAADCGVDVIRLANIPATSATANAIETIAHDRSLTWRKSDGEHSPYMTIASDWKSYLAGCSKKRRANLVRDLRPMAEAGESEMRWFDRPEDVQVLLDDMLRIEATSWKAKTGIAVSQRAAEKDYYSQLLPFLARTNSLLANVAYAGDRPIGYVLCARHNGWFGQLKTSFDEEIRRAGSRVIAESLQRAFASGCREYDFLGHVAPHKMRWTDSVRRHADYFLFRQTGRARAVVALNSVVAGARKVTAAVVRWRKAGSSTDASD